MSPGDDFSSKISFEVIVEIMDVLVVRKTKIVIRIPEIKANLHDAAILFCHGIYAVFIFIKQCCVAVAKLVGGTASPLVVELSC